MLGSTAPGLIPRGLSGYNNRILGVQNSVGGSCIYTVDGGTTWVTGGVPFVNQALTKITYYPPSGRLVCLSGSTTATRFSADGGITWAASGVTTVASMEFIVYDPTHSKLITGNPASSQTTTNFSTNGGASWSSGGALTASNNFRGSHDPAHGRVVLVGVSGLTTNYSTDGGVNWNAGGNLTSNRTWIAPVYDPISLKLITVAGNSTITNFSTDGGTTWSAGGNTPVSLNTSPLALMLP
jgi:hypothetical protein